YFLAYPWLSDQINYDDLARPNLLGLASYAGLFPHKNAAGIVFSLSLIVSLARFSGSRNAARKWASLIMICGSLLAIVMSGAVGALFGLIVGLVAGFLFRAMIRGDLARTTFAAFVLMLAVILILTIGLETALSVFGRSTDFTGRDALVQLWPTFFWE